MVFCDGNRTHHEQFVTENADRLGTYENAAKVAGHDLKGLIAYFNANEATAQDLHFPMMVWLMFSPQENSLSRSGIGGLYGVQADCNERSSIEDG